MTQIETSTQRDAAWAPSSKIFAITKHDTNELEYVTRGIYVGATGDVVVETLGGVEVTFTDVPTGAILPIAVKKVKVATTASEMVGLA